MCYLSVTRIHQANVSGSAESALSKTKEVDIPGGWKEGQPCVIIETPLYAADGLTTFRVPYAALAKVFALIEARQVCKTPSIS